MLFSIYRLLPSFLGRENSTPSRRLVRASSASAAALSQASGLNRLDNLVRSLSTPNLLSAGSNTSGQLTESTNASGSDAADLGEIQGAPEPEPGAVEIGQVVDAELQKYELDGIVEQGHPDFEDFDLVRYWQSKRSTYPLLWKASLDVLPVQASAVSCERVFSSSKETDSLRRSNLCPEMMEMLQILKFTFREDRLSFTENLLSDELDDDEGLSVVDMSPEEVDEFMSTGQIQNLSDIIDLSYDN